MNDHKICNDKINWLLFKQIVEENFVLDVSLKTIERLENEIHNLTQSYRKPLGKQLLRQHKGRDKLIAHSK